ncbi:MAG: carbohydrate ABC transporter substrate-binding protein [Burkholderiaceae bacterium]|nr:carbohydrate ABC transporter substrate-binding protein [Microbacteriaceae bacterium]
MSTSRRTLAAAITGAVTFALLASGCSSAPAPGGTPETLTLATFNDFGYTDAMLAEYTDLTGIKIVQNKAATSNDARTNYFTKLGAGSGLADVEAVEIDWFAELMQYSDKLADLSNPDLADRWVQWKADAATDPDGRLIAYGTDIGPQAICYRSDLFAAAGLPTDRAEVAALIDGDWANYFSVGEGFVANSDAAWFDSSGAILQGILNQDPETLESTDGTVIATTNPVVETAYTDVLDAGSTLSAHLSQWSDDWAAGFANGAFATMLCPGWMLGVIEGNAPEVTGWDIANVFPGGGGNWGGSYLTVPAQGKNTEAAKKFADWLTAPEQQLKAFVTTGNFPSQTSLYNADELLSVTRPYFNDAPTGQIFSDRSSAVTVAPFKGAKYFPVMDALQNAITRVDVDQTEDASASWTDFVTDVNAIG